LGACGRILGRTDFRRDRVPNTAEGWEDAQEGQSATVDHFLPIHLNGQLAVVALYENGLNAQFFAQVGRRTGGLNPRHSVATTSNRHGHWQFSAVSTYVTGNPMERIGLVIKGEPDDKGQNHWLARQSTIAALPAFIYLTKVR
jgi:hypothetical protein